MKKLLLIMFLVISFVACKNTSYKTTVERNESLINKNAQLEKSTNELVNSLIVIDDNLQEIKEKEDIIDVDLQSPENKDGRIQAQIKNDINTIYNLMIANKAQINKLKKQVSEDKNTNSRLNELVMRLNRQLVDKSRDIIKLKEELKTKEIKIDSLNFTLRGMDIALDSLNKKYKDTDTALKAAVTKLNTAYYSFGTKKELKEQHIITDNGFLSKKRILKEHFNKNYFTKIDVRKIDSIALYRPKVKILSTHPDGSYKIITNGEGNRVIKILNKRSFWSLSRFFIAQVN